ncbi:MAG: A/G-specific adenine glycosylase [Dehalococcoidia bacterium]|nr:A/G-specific adenine glycosylase [Dehalococcoidia bacterium]
MQTVTSMPDEHEIKRFRATVYCHYEAHGRDFPWRHTTDPYHILVAEIMLQQTQTGRVVTKYEEFLRRFPGFESLAAAAAVDVLQAWQGLGYNRRALALQTIARRVCADFDGMLPIDKETLRSFPGIGEYTAAAIRAFAHNLPEAFIETNIRTVFIHEFFPNACGVTDREILTLVELTLDRAAPRRWYQALMDYGAMLKESGNPSRRSTHHRRQPPFEGSRRQARGQILRTLLQTGPAALSELVAVIPGWDNRFDAALETLVTDGLVQRQDQTVSIVIERGTG